MSSPLHPQGLLSPVCSPMLCCDAVSDTAAHTHARLPMWHARMHACTTQCPHSPMHPCLTLCVCVHMCVHVCITLSMLTQLVCPCGGGQGGELAHVCSLGLAWCPTCPTPTHLSHPLVNAWCCGRAGCGTTHMCHCPTLSCTLAGRGCGSVRAGSGGSRGVCKRACAYTSQQPCNC